MNRGYGVSALVDSGIATRLAEAAEESGYMSFWVNDVPGGNGLEQLAAVQAATSTIRTGVGVLAADRWPAALIVREVNRLGLDAKRLVIGIGAGALGRGSLSSTAEIASQVRTQLPAQVMIGALGPEMCRLAGANSDGVILNWLTPAAARKSSEITRTAAAETGQPVPEVIGYVRTAAEPDAHQRLTTEATNYEAYPAYRRHFARMGVSALETTVNGSPGEIAIRLDEYAGSVDEIVVRAIAANETLESYLTVLRAARPGATE